MLTVAAPGVLANDSGESLVAVELTGASNGELVLESSGAFQYTPFAGFHGFDSFTYFATDGISDSNVATVTILVNHPPIAHDDSVAGLEDIS